MRIGQRGTAFEKVVPLSLVFALRKQFTRPSRKLSENKGVDVIVGAIHESPDKGKGKQGAVNKIETCEQRTLFMYK